MSFNLRFMRRVTVTGRIAATMLLLVGYSVCAEISQAQSSSAETTATPVQRKRIRVATKEAPPFAMFRNGKWEGISIQLWNHIAQDPTLNFETEFYDAKGVKQILEAVQGGKEAQAGVAAIAVSEDRENQVDFTYPYYNTGLAMAVLQKPGSLIGTAMIWDIVRKGLMPLIIAFTIAGAIIWLLEFRCNSAHFGGGIVRGIGSGIWWAIVTIAAGYGDKYPTGCLGRFFGIVWMLAGMVLLALFTGVVTTKLTVKSLETMEIKPAELRKYHVAFVGENSIGHKYVKKAGCADPQMFTSVKGALTALKEKRVDVVVHDAPMIEYSIKNDFDTDSGLTVLPETFSKQSYSIALPEGSPYREAINRLLIRRTDDLDWQQQVMGYLGK